MKISYKEEDYQIDISNIDGGIYLKENIFYINILMDINLSTQFEEFLDIKKYYMILI